MSCPKGEGPLDPFRLKAEPLIKPNGSGVVCEHREFETLDRVPIIGRIEQGGKQGCPDASALEIIMDPQAYPSGMGPAPLIAVEAGASGDLAV